jgi:hypothetical protein
VDYNLLSLTCSIIYKLLKSVFTFEFDLFGGLLSTVVIECRFELCSIIEELFRFNICISVWSFGDDP